MNYKEQEYTYFSSQFISPWVSYLMSFDGVKQDDIIPDLIDAYLLELCKIVDKMRELNRTRGYISDDIDKFRDIVKNG